MRNLLKKYDAMPLPAKAAAWFAVCSALQSGASFLAIPFLTRLMSQEQYGIVTLYNSWRQILIIFATLNIYCGVFNTGMSKWKNRRDAYLSSMIGLTFCLVVACALVYAVFHWWLNQLFQLDTPYMLVMFVQIFASTVFSLWSARERFEYRYRALLGMTFAYAFIGQAISVLSVWFTPGDSDKAFVSVGSLSVVLLVLALLLSLSSFKKGKTLCVPEFWKHAVLFNLPLVPHYLATLVLGQADRIMISSLNGSADAAIYGVAYTIGLMIQIVTNALSNAIVPWLYGKLERRETEGISGLFEVLTVAVGALNVLVVLVAPEVMAIAGPAEYRPGIYVIPPVAASMLFTFVYGLFAYIEFYYEKKLGVVIASIVAAIANIALNLVALPMFGFVAAGYTTLVCYGLLAIAHYAYARSILVREGLDDALNGNRILVACVMFLPVGAIAMLLYSSIIARVVLLVALVLVAYCGRDMAFEAVALIRGKSAKH